MPEESRAQAPAPLGGPVCPRCREKPAISGSVHWLTQLPVVVLGDLPRSLDYCRDCAGGLNLIYMLVWAGLFAVGFISAVILWPA